MFRILKFIIIITCVMLCVVIVASFFFLQLSPPKQNSSTPEVLTTSENETPSSYSDTIILVTKSNPYRALIVRANRVTDNQETNQISEVLFFNNNEWQTEAREDLIPNNQINFNSLIINWLNQPHPSDVLRFTSLGEISLQDQNITFASNTLQNEIAARSELNHSQFISKGEGTLTLDSKSYQAYLVYIREYNQNPSDSSLFKKVYFWDTGGNFYFVDTNQQPEIDPLDALYKLGVKESPDSSVIKTFDATLKETSESNFLLTLPAPVYSTLQFNRINEVNASEDISWGMISGNANSIFAIGVMQYTKKPSSNNL